MDNLRFIRGQFGTNFKIFEQEFDYNQLPFFCSIIRSFLIRSTSLKSTGWFELTPDILCSALKIRLTFDWQNSNFTATVYLLLQKKSQVLGPKPFWHQKTISCQNSVVMSCNGSKLLYSMLKVSPNYHQLPQNCRKKSKKIFKGSYPQNGLVQDIPTDFRQLLKC